MIRSCYIDEKLLPKRLDKVISLLFGEYSRTFIQRFIKRGMVRLSGVTITDCSYVVKNSTFLQLSELDCFDNKTKTTVEHIMPEIIFEDSDIIVLNKPYGIAVHPVSINSDSFTLVDLLRSFYGNNLSKIGGVLRPGIVHRLDKNTSGIMVVAKNDNAHDILSKAFVKKQIYRSYIAFTFGFPILRSGIISKNIKRDTKNRIKMMVTNDGSGKKAITHYFLLENFKNLVSVVKCNLKTGRTHQIRVHMSSMNNPIIGDKLYISFRNFNLLSFFKEETVLAINSISRQALHSYKMILNHPINNKLMIFKSALPNDMQNILHLLRSDI